MKTIVILVLISAIILPVCGQTIKIPSKNATNGTISGESVSIYIPRRIKIEKAVAQIDTAIKHTLEKYTKQMQADNAITDNIQTSVNAKVIEEVDSVTGKKELNFHVEYKYQVVKAKLENQTDDFPAGKYKLIASNAAKITMQQLKQAIDIQLSEYLTTGSKVTIKITGSTDGSPINNALPYNGEYGEFNETEYFLNGYLSEITINKKSGITTNEQLAFLRTYGVREFIEKYIEQLSITKNTFQHYAVVAKERGAQYRRISVELIIHDAFKNKFLDNSEVADNKQDEEKKQTANLSDVDTDIPKTNSVNNDVYALVIGNEDYSSFQTGLNSEVNVAYAKKDAETFKEYCVKTLGIPEKNVTFRPNATLGTMKQLIAKLATIAEIKDGNASLIFYYSGHGLPDETTKAGYLIPVDISGSDVKSGICIDTLYKQLTLFPCKKVTVFLDACFSGGARNQNLIALKGVKVKPKEAALSGNLVVFASSTGEESSTIYKDKQHGMFTYFLLKKLQQTKGNVTYKELANYIFDNVRLESVNVNSKKQTPQINGSQSVQNSWENWKFVE